MNRRVIHDACVLSLVLAAPLLSVAGAEAAKAPAVQDANPGAVRIPGAIVDCADYIALGPTPSDRTQIHAGNIDSGMPACFRGDSDGQLYLLIAMKGLAKERFAPTINFLGGGTTVSGTLYERGSLKAILVESVERTVSKKVVDGKAVTSPPSIEKKKSPPGADPTPDR